jgi:hypothetical protein
MLIWVEYDHDLKNLEAVCRPVRFSLGEFSLLITKPVDSNGRNTLTFLQSPAMILHQIEDNNINVRRPVAFHFRSFQRKRSRQGGSATANAQAACPRIMFHRPPP